MARAVKAHDNGHKWPCSVAGTLCTCGYDREQRAEAKAAGAREVLRRIEAYNDLQRSEAESGGPNTLNEWWLEAEHIVRRIVEKMEASHG